MKTDSEKDERTCRLWTHRLGVKLFLPPFGMNCWRLSAYPQLNDD